MVLIEIKLWLFLLILLWGCFIFSFHELNRMLPCWVLEDILQGERYFFVKQRKLQWELFLWFVDSVRLSVIHRIEFQVQRSELGHFLGRLLRILLDPKHFLVWPVMMVILRRFVEQLSIWQIYILMHRTIWPLLEVSLNL